MVPRRQQKLPRLKRREPNVRRGKAARAGPTDRMAKIAKIGQNRNDRQDRPNRSHREREGGRPFFKASSRPEPREKAADPNSPFAKLAALKAQLEADAKERR